MLSWRETSFTGKEKYNKVVISEGNNWEFGDNINKFMLRKGKSYSTEFSIIS